MKELKIQIPDNQGIDWEESAKQEQIILKDKPSTYKDVCKKLFNKKYYYTDTSGHIQRIENLPNDCSNNATTRHQLECILAKNKLANVARFLNGDWNPDKTVLSHFNAYVLYVTPDKNCIGYIKIQDCAHNSNVLFKSTELAKQAIKILGEDVVKLALEPLY